VLYCRLPQKAGRDRELLAVCTQFNTPLHSVEASEKTSMQVGKTFCDSCPSTIAGAVWRVDTSRCMSLLWPAGVGFEVAKQLLTAGHSVILACRDTSKAAAAVSQLQQHSIQPVNTEAAPAAGHNQSSSSTASAVSAVQCDLAC